MLKRTNSIYFLVTGLLILLLIPFVESKWLTLYVFTFLNFVFYFLAINSSNRLKATKKNLVVFVFFYSIIFVTLYNCLSYYFEGNFFLFSTVDAVSYHNYSKRMALMPFFDSINFYLKYWAVDDLGAVLIISTLYRLIESNLFYNLVNIFFGVISAIGMFRISNCFMSFRYAFSCSLTFALSSYIIWFHSSGLKESYMLMIVILFYDQFYMYMRKGKVTYIVLAIILISSLIFFRPVLIFFAVGSVGLGLILTQKNSKKILVATFLCLIILGFYPFLEIALEQYLRDGDLERVLIGKALEGMVIGSLPFTYFVNVISQIMGPLPTLLPKDDPKLVLYSAGLIYRALLTFPFWVGVYFIFKFKIRKIYPLIFFALMEMCSLVLIIEGLELRKSLPHFPIIYIVAFWFMSFLQTKNINKTRLIKYLYIAFSIGVLFLIYYWNLRG